MLNDFQGFFVFFFFWRETATDLSFRKTDVKVCSLNEALIHERLKNEDFKDSRGWNKTRGNILSHIHCCQRAKFASLVCHTKLQSLPLSSSSSVVSLSAVAPLKNLIQQPLQRDTEIFRILKRFWQNGCSRSWQKLNIFGSRLKQLCTGKKKKQKTAGIQASDTQHNDSSFLSTAVKEGL